jgi:fatty-acyl-CoA synthase
VRGPAADAPRHATVGEMLRAAARAECGVTFADLQERETALGWREVYARARRVAAALAGLGVRAGDRVVLVLPTGPAFLDAFFGAVLAGAVPVPAAPPQRLGRLDEYHAAVARIVRATGARLVVTDAAVKRLLGVAVEASRPALGCAVAADLLGGRGELEREGAPDALAMIQFSSGSTVDPKPVALTHANLMAQVATIDQALSDDGGTVVSWLPLHHDMGLIGCLLYALYRPVPLVLIPPELFLARPALWLRALSRHRARSSPAPNFAYALCLKRIKDEDLEGVDLSNWRSALNGAEPISVGVLEAFAERFSRWGLDPRALRPVYGMAEASLAVTFSPPGRLARTLEVDARRLASEGAVAPGRRRLASVGVPVPGMEVEVRGPDGAELGERRVGRVWVRGPSVMEGYFGNAEATARALVGGWLDTGDLGFVEGGELFVCGRAKDVVIIRGANHPPQEFEECLDGLPGARAGCAVALGFVPPSDAAGGEELLILAERAERRATAAADEALADAIRNAVLRRTGVRPHTVAVLAPGTLPRTTSGKLRRAEALRRFLAGELEPPREVTPLRVAGAMTRSTLAFAKLRATSAR